MINKSFLSVVFICAALTLSACGGKSVEERLVEAEQAYADGDMRQTLLASREALQREPDNARARMMRALASKAIGDFGTAEADFERALAAGIDDPRLILGLGDLYLIMQQPAKTMELLQSNPAVVDDNLDVALLAVDAALVMGDAGRTDAELERIRVDYDATGVNEFALRELQLLLLLEDVDSAEEKAGALRDAAPDLAPVFTASAGIAQSQRRFAEAAELYRKAADLWRAQGLRFREISVRYQVALNYLEADMLEEATESVDKFSAISPQAAPAKFLRAALLLKTGDVESANALLREANSDAPGNPQYLRLLGLTELSLGNLGQSEQYLRSALRDIPSDPMVRSAMAEIALRQGRVGDAVDILRDLAGSGSGYTARLGQALILDGQVDEAISLLEGYAAQGPADRSIQMILARAYAEKGDLARSESMLAEAMETDDQDYTAALALIRSYMSRGDTGSAEALVEELLTERADDPRAHGAAAWFLYAIGRTDEAVERAREAAKRFPDSAATQLTLGKISIATNDLLVAETSLAQALDIDPDNIDALMEMARLRQMQEQPAAALALLEKADGLTKNDFRPAMALASIALRDRQMEDALRWSDRLTEIAPNRAMALALRAAVLNATGQIESTIATMVRAVQQSDATPEMFRSLARLQAATGDNAAADATIERGLSRFSDNRVLRAEQAWQALNSGDFDLAEEQADALLAEAPDQSMALLIKGQLHYRRGELSEARSFFEQADKAGAGEQAVLGRYAVANRALDNGRVEILRTGFERYPESQALALLLAGAEQTLGDRARAMQIYEQILVSAPVNAVALNNLAWMLNEDGNRDEALDLSRRAVEAAPEAPDVLDTYGVILLGMGETGEAVAILEKAYAQSAENPEIRYHLAQALHQSGDTPAAIAHLRAVVASDARTEVLNDAEKLLATLSE